MLVVDLYLNMGFIEWQASISSSVFINKQQALSPVFAPAETILAHKSSRFMCSLDQFIEFYTEECHLSRPNEWISTNVSCSDSVLNLLPRTLLQWPRSTSFFIKMPQFCSEPPDQQTEIGDMKLKTLHGPSRRIRAPWAHCSNYPIPEKRPSRGTLRSTDWNAGSCDKDALLGGLVQALPGSRSSADGRVLIAAPSPDRKLLELVEAPNERAGVQSGFFPVGLHFEGVVSPVGNPLRLQIGELVLAVNCDWIPHIVVDVHQPRIIPRSFRWLRCYDHGGHGEHHHEHHHRVWPGCRCRCHGCSCSKSCHPVSGSALCFNGTKLCFSTCDHWGIRDCKFPVVWWVCSKQLKLKT